MGAEAFGGVAHEVAHSIATRLKGAERIVLTTHITPDGDGLGAAIALMRYLRSEGKSAEVINCSTAPQNLRFLYKKGEFFVFADQGHRQRIANADVIIATDLGGSARLGKMLEPVRSSKATKIVIDHHIYENDLFDLPLIVPTASSSAEITFDLISLLGGPITREIAEPLYVGLITDTGNFSYTATSARCLEMAAQLVRAGAEPHQLWRRLSCTVPFLKMKFLGLCLTRLCLEANGRVVWTTVETDLLRRSEIPARDAFEVVNHFLLLDGVEVGVFFMEISKERTKVSLRSAGTVDVCAIAQGHGGGGHRFAAGCVLETSGLGAAIPLILREVMAALGSAPEGPQNPSPPEDES